jgi:hypothetical protein
VAYDDNDIHVAASVLKAYFRSLPESLIPENIFNEIIGLRGNTDRSIIRIKSNLILLY